MLTWFHKDWLWVIESTFAPRYCISSGCCLLTYFIFDYVNGYDIKLLCFLLHPGLNCVLAVGLILSAVQALLLGQRIDATAIIVELFCVFFLLIFDWVKEEIDSRRCALLWIQLFPFMFYWWVLHHQWCILVLPLRWYWALSFIHVQLRYLLLNDCLEVVYVLFHFHFGCVSIIGLKILDSIHRRCKTYIVLWTHASRMAALIESISQSKQQRIAIQIRLVDLAPLTLLILVLFFSLNNNLIRNIKPWPLQLRCITSRSVFQFVCFIQFMFYYPPQVFLTRVYYWIFTLLVLHIYK